MNILLLPLRHPNIFDKAYLIDNYINIGIQSIHTSLPINSKVEDAWRLEEGDSLMVNIHNNEIIAFEKK